MSSRAKPGSAYGASASGRSRGTASRRGNWLLAGCAALCIAGVGAALVSQYRFQMDPCPWCVLQRVIFLAIALACLIGLVWRSATGQRSAATLALLLTLCGAAAALWQHFYAASSQSCNMTLADKIVTGIGLDTWLPDVFSARASCADAAVSLLGVPYDFWSLGLFALVGIALLGVFGATRPRLR